VTAELLVIPAAIILDWLLGDPRWFPHPVICIGKLITFLEPRLRRAVHGEFAGGVILLVLTVATTTAVASLLLSAAYLLHHTAGVIVAIILSWNCLAARSLHRESGLVAKALANGDLAGARRYLSFIVGRDTAGLQEPEIWRGAVETVAENSSDGVIAPLFFLMLGGPVLGLAYKAVNTLDSMVGYKNESYMKFGWASARFDDLVNWLPARLTGLLMILASPLAGLHAKSSWQIMQRDSRNHTSPNSGIPEAAAAGALKVQIGGTNFYFGKPVEKPAIGDPLKPLDIRAWQGAVRLMYGAEGLLLLLWLIFTGINRI
jgi:adenosylcobinamide-phosphate synthase